MPNGAKTSSKITFTTTRYDLTFECTGIKRTIRCTLAFEKDMWILTFNNKPEEIHGFDIARVIWDIFNTDDLPAIDSLHFEGTYFSKKTSYESHLESVLGMVKLTAFLKKWKQKRATQVSRRGNPSCSFFILL